LNILGYRATEVTDSADGETPQEIADNNITAAWDVNDPGSTISAAINAANQAAAYTPPQSSNYDYYDDYHQRQHYETSYSGPSFGW